MLVLHMVTLGLRWEAKYNLKVRKEVIKKHLQHE